jgi:hypothetical protein|nr:MAG TPA: hypothetical protein [Caudoviricetes sp.]DAG47509.1 MAG TPA: hypothetical protein [Caudoviricetes sp.]DAH10269.1 MAG TPA: hypothetical protein [Caudoviricetes sp.]DAM80740.1 MAG TPA: hypothetical protein [Caudoviricetes sp.]
MVADQPLVVYPKTKKEDGPKKHTKKEMDDLYDGWMEKKKKEGSLVGETINLVGYLNNKL